MSSRIINYLSIGVFIIAIYFMVLHRLGAFPMQLWDEARLANNAFEMSKDHNFLLTHFDGKPDMWNTKPPLMIWCMLASMEMFGYNEFAMRLPSACAGIATVFFLIILCFKLSGNFYLGIFSGLTLLTSWGFVGLHVLKTGDYDALLILFMTLYAFMYFLYLYWDLNERKYIYLFVLFLCLAMLTKGIAGLMLLPALFIYTLLEKKLKATMVNSDFWKAGGIFLICTLGYYLLREQYNPGYIAAVIDNEITGRYLEVVEKHNAPFSFYFTNMINERYLPWIYIFPFSVIICYVSKNRIARDLLVFCLINIFAYFLIISFGMTKLKWYDAPLYPFLAIINGCALWIIFQYIVDKVKFPFRKEFLFPAFAFIIFFYPYKQNAKIFFTFLASPPHPDVQFSGFMNELKTSNPELREYAVIPRWVEMYHGHASFFVKLFNSQGYSLSIASLQTNKLKESSYAMASEEKTKWLLQTMYHCKIISTYKNCILYQIISQVDSYPSAILKLAKLEIQGSEAMMSTIEKSAKENSRNFEQELHLYAIDYLERNKNITSAEADYLKLKLPDNRK